MFRLALAYFAGTFALGFALGTVRTLWLAPAMGETGAVLAELPLMLGFSWWWARRLLRRQPLPRRSQALAMGGLALLLLLAAELALTLLLGRGAGQWLDGLSTPAGALGLAGQLGFAVMPWWVRCRLGLGVK
jgi:hypothetical protein